MFGFLASKDNSINGYSPNPESSLHIHHVLQWLHQHNHLYKSFFSNYETLFRYVKPKFINPLLLEKHMLLEEVLQDEAVGMAFPVDSKYFDQFPLVFEERDIAAVQHPQPQESECRNTLQQLVTDLQPLGDGGATDLQLLWDSQDAADLQSLGDSQDAADLQPLGNSQNAADLQPSETVKTQQISNPSETVKTQQISNPPMEMQQISNPSPPTSVRPHPLPFIQTYPYRSTISKLLLVCLFNNLAPIAIYITIYCYPTDPPLLPTPAWAFPPPPLPMQRTPHEVPNPSHT